MTPFSEIGAINVDNFQEAKEDSSFLLVFRCILTAKMEIRCTSLYSKP